MNILVELPSNVIKYYGYDYILKEDRVEILYNGKVRYIDLTMDVNNAEVYDVDIIDFFVGNKYLYLNNQVIENPDYQAGE